MQIKTTHTKKNRDTYQTGARRAFVYGDMFVIALPTQLDIGCTAHVFREALHLY